MGLRSCFKCFGEKRRKAIGLSQGEKNLSEQERGLMKLWWLRVLSLEERRHEVGGLWGGGVLSSGRRVHSGCAMQFLLYHNLCLYPVFSPPKYNLHICCFPCRHVRFVLILRWSCFIWVTCKMTGNICLLIQAINKAIHVELLDTQHPEHLLCTCHYSVQWEQSNTQGR